MVRPMNVNAFGLAAGRKHAKARRPLPKSCSAAVRHIEVCYLFGREVAATADPACREVILARKEAKSRTRTTGLRSKTTKASTRVDSRASRAQLEKKLEARPRELSEAREQPRAPAEGLCE